MIPLVVALAAFVGTLAFENPSWWWHSHDESSATGAMPARPIPRPQSRDPEPQPSFVRTLLEQVVPKQLRRAPPREGTQPEQTEPDVANAADNTEEGLPLSEQENPGFVQVRPPADGKDAVAVFRNMGSRGLEFTISSVDPAGNVHSTIHVTPQNRKPLILNDLGLLVLPGDQILVQSPPYKDFSVSVN